MKYCFLILFIMGLLGCNTLEKGQSYFKANLDLCVLQARHISLCSNGILLKQNKIKNGVSYQFGHDESKYSNWRCQWIVYTDLNFIVVSWKYLGNPDVCYLKTSWAGPW